jgi:hypothetical protein
MFEPTSDGSKLYRITNNAEGSSRGQYLNFENETAASAVASFLNAGVASWDTLWKAQWETWNQVRAAARHALLAHRTAEERTALAAQTFQDSRGSDVGED